MPATAAQTSHIERPRLVTIVDWSVRVVAAVVLLQTLYFKFSAAPESVYIFTRVGAEPWGRIGSGIVELIAAILLIVPRSAWLGAAIAAGVMAGAIISHLTLLGIEVMGDGGLLFGLALLVFVASLVTLFVHRAELPIVGERLR